MSLICTKNTAYSDAKRQLIWVAAMAISKALRKHGDGPINNEQLACMLSDERSREAIDMLHDLRDRVRVPANLVATAMLAINAGV